VRPDEGAKFAGRFRSTAPPRWRWPLPQRQPAPAIHTGGQVRANFYEVGLKVICSPSARCSLSSLAIGCTASFHRSADISAICSFP